MTWQLLGLNAGLVLAMMTILWVVSVVKRNASIVDPWWSMIFLLITGHTSWATGLTPAKTVVVILVAIWALRLWLHLLTRNWGHGEDPRYVAFRRQYGPERYWWVSFFQVFLLQGALALVISAPLQLLAAAALPDPVGLWTVLGALVFAVGLGFEGVADAQLRAFRRDPAQRGQVLDSGLWHYSRHPNYFGEAVLWWGFGLCALAVPYGWVTVFGPALMTYLLVKVSGVAMLDALLKETKPGYVAYVQRTPAFVPGRPR
ncbi:MAG: DUF1295 domain-containing protein [Candidatus Sericytochromatia bacterium]|nr:DUF1295 domain-containing protein [Candidatus Sericytochromatia bacterium]